MNNKLLYSFLKFNYKFEFKQMTKSIPEINREYILHSYVIPLISGILLLIVITNANTSISSIYR